MGFACTLASGSSGNAALFSHGDTHILVDMGITYSRLCAQLGALGLSPRELAAVLVTHAHGDHVSGLSVLCRKQEAAARPALVIAGAETARTLARANPALKPFLRAYTAAFEIGGIAVEPFATPHDAPGSAGYLLHMGGFRAAVGTDMGYVPPDALAKLSQAHYILLEANHDTDMLRYGPYPAMLKRRVMGNAGHLSNDDCARAAVHCVLRGAKRITLCHLSEDNNSPDLALGTVAHALAESGCEGFTLDVAPRYDTGDPEYFGELSVMPGYEAASAPLRGSNAAGSLC